MVFIFSSYWIYKNVKIDDLIGDTSVVTNADIDSKKAKVNEFEIRNNDIVRVLPAGEFETLVNGEDIEGLESVVSLSVSPDSKRLCFLVQTMVPIWMYTFDLGSGELTKIDVATNCYWSPDGNNIAYNNHTTDVSDIDVYLYNFNSGEIENISEDVTPTPTDLLKQCQEIYWEDNENLRFGCQLRKFKDFEDSSFVTFIYNLPNNRINL
jgi:hypothetical protein